MDIAQIAVAVELIEPTLLNTPVASPELPFRAETATPLSTPPTSANVSSELLSPAQPSQAALLAANLPIPQLTPALLDTIADAIVANGYVILPNALPADLTEALRLRVEQAPADDFRLAAIGRGAEQQLNQQIRSDRIRWLTKDSEPDAHYLALMDSLRQGLNQRLFMGLFDYESHYAWYRPEAFYQKHLDALRGSQNRILTTVFFLNHDWQAEQGGALKLYDEDDSLLHTVLPEFGTLVIFLSERFPHEVCPTTRGRGSIAGWFRVSNSHYGF